MSLESIQMKREMKTYHDYYLEYTQASRKPKDKIFIVQGITSKKYLFVSKNEADCFKWILRQEILPKCRVLRGDLNSPRNIGGAV